MDRYTVFCQGACLLYRSSKTFLIDLPSESGVTVRDSNTADHCPLVWCQTLSVNHNPLWHYIDSSQKCTPKQSYLSLARQCVIMPNLCVGAIHYVLKGFVINVSSFLHTGWITCWCFFLIHVAGSIVTDIVAPSSIPFQLIKINIYNEI